MRALLEAAGLEGAAAGTVAASLVWTSLRGTDSHGVARVPSWTPSRYLPVSIPWASGEKTIAPTPSRPSTSSRSSSIQRLSSEYDGWWIKSGVPSPRRISIASAVRAPE